MLLFLCFKKHRQREKSRTQCAYLKNMHLKPKVGSFLYCYYFFHYYNQHHNNDVVSASIIF